MVREKKVNLAKENPTVLYVLKLSNSIFYIKFTEMLPSIFLMKSEAIFFFFFFTLYFKECTHQISGLVIS